MWKLRPSSWARSEKAVRHLISSGQLKNASPDGRVQIDAQDLGRWTARNKLRS
jgi:hypothetical protein